MTLSKVGHTLMKVAFYSKHLSDIVPKSGLFDSNGDYYSFSFVTGLLFKIFFLKTKTLIHFYFLTILDENHAFILGKKGFDFIF